MKGKITIVVRTEDDKEKSIQILLEQKQSIDHIEFVVDEQMWKSLQEKEEPDANKIMKIIKPDIPPMQDITGYVKQEKRREIQERKENNKWALRHYKHK